MENATDYWITRLHDIFAGLEIIRLLLVSDPGETGNKNESGDNPISRMDYHGIKTFGNDAKIIVMPEAYLAYQKDLLTKKYKAIERLS